jgi:stress-induced morphogen
MQNPLIRRLSDKLQDLFHPESLMINDNSEAHKDHYDFEDGTISHLQISIGALSMKHMSTLERHRAIYKVVSELLGDVHSVSIKFE